GLSYFIIGLCYYEFVRWAGQGQYDFVGLLFLILSIHKYRSEKYVETLLYYGIALFFHFRALLLLGVILLTIAHMLKTKAPKNSLFNQKTLPLNFISAALGLIAAITFYWNLTFLSDSSLY